MRTYILYILFLSSTHIFSQNADEKTIWIKGTVLNSDQKPATKAVIFLDSAMTKTKTDKWGKFEIGIGTDTKYISAYTQDNGVETIPYQGNNEVMLVFSKSGAIMSLGKLQELGFSTTAIRTGKKPKDYSKYLNMYQLIANEVPGALVSATTIRLRGNAINSVEGGQDPLIIVDGVVVGSIEYIFPADVATVKVMRNENASIYGVRGANGVILIEMKK